MEYWRGAKRLARLLQGMKSRGRKSRTCQQRGLRAAADHGLQTKGRLRMRSSTQRRLKMFTRQSVSISSQFLCSSIVCVCVCVDVC